MLFNSVSFLIFFPIAVTVYFLFPKKYAYLWLLACSLYFYASWNPPYLILILISIAATYTCGRVLDNINKSDKTNKTRDKKLALTICLVVNLGILFFFKYYNFFTESISTITGSSLPLLQVLLPVGISFYTFQAIGYTIDVYRGELSAEKNFLRYALFVSFFPQLVAGPIERAKNLLPQINAPRVFKYDNVVNGLLTMSWGFFLKMVIADRLAIMVDAIYSQPETQTGGMLIAGTILLTFQVYCDFSSYSTIATGAAKILGFTLMENFKAPYSSTSITEFWQRWHISLSTFFGDYLYFPLGGSKKGVARTYINLFIVFFISGLWHGASWTFVVWGSIHGLYRILDKATKKARHKFYDMLHINVKSVWFTTLCRVIVFLLLAFPNIFFRSVDLPQAFGVLTQMITDTSLSDFAQLANLGLGTPELVVAFLSLAALFLHDELYIHNIFMPTKGYKRYALFYVLVMATLVFGVYGADYVAQPFVYFQF